MSNTIEDQTLINNFNQVQRQLFKLITITTKINNRLQETEMSILRQNQIIEKLQRSNQSDEPQPPIADTDMPVNPTPMNEAASVPVEAWVKLADVVRKAFMIGQRVVLNGEEIGTVMRPESQAKGIWVFSPSKGYASAYAEHNVKPLPDGQL